MEKISKINSEVRTAIKQNTPIVALESTIISHGMPFPQNEKTAFEVQEIIRDNGATPATVAVIKGKLTVGLTNSEIKELARNPDVKKISKSNLHACMSRGQTGSTTVAATLIACKIFGLKFFATGGIGGVHRYIEDLDISADLFELAQGNCTVICSGPKAILDVPKTIEVLEAFGVSVVAYQQDEVPSFWSRNSKAMATVKANSIDEIVAMHNLKEELNTTGCQLIVNPVPEKFQIKTNTIEPIIKRSIEIMRKKNVKGKAVTPFLLNQIATDSNGMSLDTNIALIKSNAALASRIAKKACKKINS